MRIVFFLFMLVQITVSEDYLKDWKLVNSSVQLDVQKKDYKFFDVTWLIIKNNTKNNIMKYTDETGNIRNHPDYKGRVEFNKKTHSLTLMNLQKHDSGLYEAEAELYERATIAKYQLYVLDPVEDPVLSVSCHQSNDTCNVTLTCKAQNLSITHVCCNDNCDMKNVETHGDSSLSISLYVSNSFIICNHSNPVSWKNDTLKMEKVKNLCPSKEDKEKLMASETSWTAIIMIIISVVLVVSICSTVYAIYNKRTRRTTDSGNTVYEEVKGDKKAESIKMSENLETPGTVYCTVGKPAQVYSNDESTVSTANPGSKEMDPGEMNPDDSHLYDTPDKDQGTRSNYNGVESSIPQTIYATVNKAGKPM